MRYYFYIQASNSSGSSAPKKYSLNVVEPPVIQTWPILSNGNVGVTYSQAITALGTARTMKWELAGGSLPPGLEFKAADFANKRIARITGTPTQSGTYRFTIKCSNLNHEPNTTATRNFRIEIKGGNEWLDSNLRPVYGYFYNGTVGQSYSDYDRCYNSVPNGLVVSGDCPEGLNFSISGQYIRLQGIPKKAGTYKFSLHPYRNDGGYWNSGVYTVKINTGTDPLRISYTFRNGKRLTNYNDYVKVAGGTAPYTASIISGSLPRGFYLSQEGNLTWIRGITLRYGTYPFTLRVTDSNGSSVDKPFSITIANNSLRSGAPDDDKAVKPSITSKTLPDAAVDNEWSATLEAYGTQPIKWSIEGSMPEWLYLDEDSGKLSGIPTAIGKYSFKVKAENAKGSKTKKLKVKVITEKPTIETSTLPNGVLKAPYEVKLEVSGTEPIKWSKSGKMPSGLKLNKKEGKIVGTPKKAGSYTFTLKAKNKAGYDSVTYTIVIKEQEDEKAEAETSSASVASTMASLSYDDDSDVYTKLFLLNNDEKFEGAVNYSAGVPANFVIDKWVDTKGNHVEVSDVKIFVDDEFAEGIVVSDDGTFTLPKETVSSDFNVYATAKYGEQELNTSEIYISTAENETGQNNSSSSGCSVGAGIAGAFFALLAFMKKAKR